MNRRPWSRTIGELAEELETDAGRGLRSEQAAERLARLGPNRLPEAAQTMTLMALVATELMWAALVRSAYGAALFSNPWLFLTIGGSAALQLFVLYVPELRSAFGLVLLEPREWALLAALTAAGGLAGAGVNRLMRGISSSS